MKNLIGFFLAAMVGGLVSFALLKNQLTSQNQTDSYHNKSPRAVMTSNTSASVLGTDFITASKMATPAVVHIKASESRALAQQRSDDRRNNRSRNTWDMNDFFGDDFFWGRRRAPKDAAGSGVIISSDGYIVTNNHVVGFADEINITLDDGREFVAQKIGTDPSSDLAVLKIEGSNLPYINYGNSDVVEVGEWVLAVGNPFDYLTSTVTAGIVSAKGRDIKIIRDDKPIEEFIQTDAAINPGNSGGALVNTEGDLIGINTAIATPTGVFAGYSFAIPSRLVEKIVNEIIEVGGDIDRAYLGVNVADLNQLYEQGIEVDAPFGIYVDDVIKGGSAQFAGILPGDIIQEVNGKKVEVLDDLTENLKFIKVGDQLKLKILRKGKSKTLTVNIR